MLHLWVKVILVQQAYLGLKKPPPASPRNKLDHHIYMTLI